MSTQYKTTASAFTQKTSPTHGNAGSMPRLSVNEQARQLRRDEMASILAQATCALVATLRSIRRHIST